MKLWFTALLCSLPVIGFAGECGVNFNYGVVINPKHIRFVEHGQTRVQINHNQLFIDGREQNLTISQQANLALYRNKIKQQVPYIIGIALEGVDLGLKTVTRLIAGLTGENSASHQKIQERFSELQQRFHLQFNQTSENFYLAPQDFNEFDQIFAGEFEQEIEQIVSESVGTLLLAVGEAISQDQDIGIEHRSTSLAERIKVLSKDLKKDIGQQGTALQQKAQSFCQDLIALDDTENQLHQAIPQLKPFDLIEVNKKQNNHQQQ